MRRCFLTLWLMVASTACAQWQLASQSSPTALGHGAWQVTKQVDGPSKVELQLIYFNTTDCTLHVVDQPKKDSAVKMDVIAAREKALAICNGGYFSPDEFTPSGLQIAQGNRSGVFQKGMPFGGGILVRSGKPVLYTDIEFVDDSSITELVQCCPMLVNEGKALTEKGGGQLARRTFILTDQADHWAIGVANRIGLRELADVLTTAGIITEFKVMRALNLDGGPSTGLWWQGTQSAAAYKKEMWPVKNLIMITPKP
ncbi:MAG: hypothetical protein RL693_745 [Verrucomicrobiota bacterium]